MQKILFITAYPPNHRSGGQSFSSNVIRELSNKYLIDLIYFSYAEHEIDITELINKIIVLKPSMFNCFKLPFVFPLFTRRYNKIINSFIQSIAPQYSVIYFDYSQVGFYSLHITHPNKIIRCHDVIAQKISRTIPLLESWVKYSEGKILKSANTIFVPSQKDTDLIYNYYGIQSIFTNEYLHDFIFPDNILLVRSFIFFGLWSRKENLNGLVWFIKKVYPLLDKSIKDKLVVMGGGLPDVINIKYLKPNNIQY